MIKKIYLLLLLVIAGPTINAQCLLTNDVFGDGELVTYTVSYNWGPVWVDAGLVTFSAKSELYHGKPSWHLISTGKTFSSYDVLFKVRDRYDTWIDPLTFSTFEFKRYIFEGGYMLQNTLVFDYQKGKILSNTKSNNNRLRTDTLRAKPCTFDMLSAIYYTRTLDLASLKHDIRYPVNIMIDDSVYHIYIRPAGREIVENTDGKRYHCLKFHAKMVGGTIFKGDEDVTVWVTDDRNKIPVYVEAHIQIGTIKAYLKEAKGVKNPMSSLVR